MMTTTSAKPPGRSENGVIRAENSKAPPRILVVDDDEQLQMLLCDILSRVGYRVMAVSNGQQCLEACEHYHPDLIILDIQMPVMDGLTCCQQLKALPNSAHIPVLMLTARNDVQSRQHVFAAGATDFMTKPCKVNVLLDRIHQLVSNRIEEYAEKHS